MASNGLWRQQHGIALRFRLPQHKIDRFILVGRISPEKRRSLPEHFRNDAKSPKRISSSGFVMEVSS
jgi:hypothetical protein